MNTALLSISKNPLTVLRRRLISLFLALLTVFAAGGLNSLAATGEAELSAFVTELDNGNYRIDVKLTMQKNTRFNSLQAFLNYNADAFTTVSYENTSGLNNSLLNDKVGRLAIVWNGSEENACDSAELNLFSAVFSVKSGTSSGKYDFTLTNVELLYGLEDEIDVAVNNASVTVAQNLSYITGTAVLTADGNYKIEVSLKLPSNVSTSGVQAALSYDSDAFSYVSCESGEFGRNALIHHNENKKQVYFLYDTTSPYSSNNSILLFSAIFSVKDTAVAGNYGFDIICEDLLGNTEASSLPFKTVSPSVKLVVKKISSDVYTIKNGYLGGIESGTLAETVISNVHDFENITIKNNGILVDGVLEVKSNMDIILTVDGAVADTLKIAINGDVNGDGDIDIRDLARLKKSLAGIEREIIDVAADLNRNDKSDAGDLAELRRLLLSE